jgi:two-component system, chemotaxis family, protein-glutamate methylesterase/glutaminase
MRYLREGVGMSTHDIIAIGGSTGALDALKHIFADLPADLPAAVFVVSHLASNGGDMLANILDAAGPMVVKTAAAGDLIQNGRTYIAPAGHHLLVDNGTVRLGHGPRENMVRPAIDPLFRSAAVSYGPRVIAVVLSGMLDDGAAGLAAVKRCGGLTIVQDPADAEAADMPLNALDACDVDYRVPAGKMAQVLTQLTKEPAPPAFPVPGDIALEVQIAAGRPSTTEVIARIAVPVALSCPSCSGTLSEIVEPSRVRFRCQIGHAYTASVLDKEQEVAVAEAVGVALRVLEERHTLLIKMAADAERRGQNGSARQYAENAAGFRQQADTIRKAAIDGIV